MILVETTVINIVENVIIQSHTRNLEKGKGNLDISIFTMTLGGRDKYLRDCVSSVGQATYEAEMLSIHTENPITIEHHVIFQGCKNNLYDLGLKNFDVIAHELPQNIGIGAGINYIVPHLSGKLTLKFDDDCKIISKDFFSHCMFLDSVLGKSIWAPMVGGLQNNLCGVKGYAHSSIHDEENDSYYQLRRVHHVGGICRFARREIYEGFTFPNDLDKSGRISGTEDGDLSTYAQHNSIPMYYLDTAIYVEHNEGTLSQTLRYKDYFKLRG